MTPRGSSPTNNTPIDGATPRRRFGLSSRGAVCGHVIRGRAASVGRPRIVDPATAMASQVQCVAALSGGRVLSGSQDHTLKLWDAVEAKMAVRVWLRKMRGSNKDVIKHIVKFL